MPQIAKLVEIDDSDRVAAQSAFERITTKSALTLEIMVQDLGTIGLRDDTPVPDKLNIAKFMSEVSSAPHQSKKAVPEGGGSGGPTLIVNIPGRGVTLQAEPPERVIEGEVVVGESRGSGSGGGDDPWADGAWGLL